MAKSGGRRSKRVLTEARKEQNRVAQRAYRQRQKEASKSYLKCQDNVGSRSRNLRPLKPCGTECNALQQSSEPLSSHSISEEQVEQQEVSVPSETVRRLDRSQTPEELSWPLHDPLEDVPTVNLVELPLLSVPTYPVSGVGLGMEDMPTIWNSRLISDLTTEAPENPESTTALSSSELRDYQYSQLIPDSTPWPILLPAMATSRIFNSEDFSQTLQDSSNQETQDMQLETTSLSLDAKDQTSITHITSPSHLPDPYWSSIQFFRTCMFTASLRNAVSLGITLNQLMTTQYRSPFYRPSSLGDDTTALIATASNPLFPPHLQPTLPQILFPHHAYLDLIPFPVLRARAITMAATRPQLFHPMDLKKDIMNDGIIYVGTRNSGGSGGGQSWDMRSWKIEPWFLRKWRMLIVGENGGMI